MAKKDNSLAKMDEGVHKGFMDAVKQRYLEQHADDALRLLADAKKVAAAHEKLQKWVERLEKGDITALEEYKKRRKRVEDVDDAEL